MWGRKKKDGDSRAAGKEARKRAEEDLEQANEQWDEVRKVAESLRRMQRKNNFGEAIENIMRGENK